jgi:hypothetical protein
MQARRTVFAQRGEKGKSNAELIEHLSSGRRDVRCVDFEFIPGRHRISSVSVIFAISSPMSRKKRCTQNEMFGHWKNRPDYCS